MHDAQEAERLVQRASDRWRVREISATKIPGAHGSHCLICESDVVVRRLWNYPKNWFELSEDELWELCERSIP